MTFRRHLVALINTNLKKAQFRSILALAFNSSIFSRMNWRYLLCSLRMCNSYFKVVEPGKCEKDFDQYFAISLTSECFKTFPTTLRTYLFLGGSRRLLWLVAPSRPKFYHDLSADTARYALLTRQSGRKYCEQEPRETDEGRTRWWQLVTRKLGRFVFVSFSQKRNGIVFWQVAQALYVDLCIVNASWLERFAYL